MWSPFNRKIVVGDLFLFFAKASLPLAVFVGAVEIFFNFSRKEGFAGLPVLDAFPISAHLLTLLVSVVMFYSVLAWAISKLLSRLRVVPLILGTVPFLLLGTSCFFFLNRWYYSVGGGRYLTDLSHGIVLLIALFFLLLGLAIFFSNILFLTRAMTRRKTLLFCGVLGSLLTGGWFHFLTSARRLPDDFVDKTTKLVVDSRQKKALPNVVFLTYDQWEACSTPFLGLAHNTTPHLKAIEKEFFVFKKSYAASRNTRSGSAALFTGQSPLKTRVFNCRRWLRDVYSFYHFPRFLHELGYRGEYVGERVCANPQKMRLYKGFDQANGRVIEESEFDPHSPAIARFLFPIEMDWIEEILEDYALQFQAVAVHSRGLHDRNDAALARPGPFRAKNVVEALKRLAQKKQPFLLRYHSDLTHTSVPTELKKKFNFFSRPLKDCDAECLKYRDRNSDPNRQMSTPKERAAKYLDSVFQADFELDEMIRVLKEAGQWDNTIFIIATDHQVRYRIDGRPLTFLMHVPGFKSGRTIDVPVWHLDIAPTILDLVGIDVPVDFEGRSLLPLMRGDKGVDAEFKNRLIHIAGGIWDELIELTVIKDGYRFYQQIRSPARYENSTRPPIEPSTLGWPRPPQLYREYQCEDAMTKPETLPITPELQPLYDEFKAESDRLLVNEPR